MTVVIRNDHSAYELSTERKSSDTHDSPSVILWGEREKEERERGERDGGKEGEEKRLGKRDVLP